MQLDSRIVRRLKLHDLRYLLAVVQAGSMAKAAPLLSVSQPVISKAIASLEDTLGVRLLDRSPRGVELTVYGRTLVASSHAIFDELRQGIQDIKHLRDPSGGELFIGSNEAAQLGLIPSVIDRIRLQHPRIVIHIVLANTTAERHRALRERRIEFSIGRVAASREHDEFETEELYDEPLFVVVGAHNPWACRAGVELADLTGEPWILPAVESASGQAAAEVFRASGLPVPQASVATSPFPLIRSLLENGPFLSFLPASVLSFLSENSRLRVVPVTLPMRAGPVGIVKLKKRTLSPLARLFIDGVRAVVASDANLEAKNRA